MERLGLANERLMTGEGLREASEPTVRVDIIHDHRAAGPQNGPRSVHLEANIMFAMEAVMNEQVDFAELGKRAWKAASARTTNVGPSMRESPIDGHADLFVQFTFEGWQINTPEVTRSVPLERFED